RRNVGKTRNGASWKKKRHGPQRKHKRRTGGEKRRRGEWSRCSWSAAPGYILRRYQRASRSCSALRPRRKRGLRLSKLKRNAWLLFRQRRGARPKPRPMLKQYARLPKLNNSGSKKSYSVREKQQPSQPRQQLLPRRPLPNQPQRLRKDSSN